MHTCSALFVVLFSTSPMIYASPANDDRPSNNFDDLLTRYESAQADLPTEQDTTAEGDIIRLLLLRVL